MKPMQSVEMRIPFIALMERWATKETSLRIRDFCTENGFKYDSLKLWIQEHQDLYDAYYQVKLLLLDRKRKRRADIKKFGTEINELIIRRRNEEAAEREASYSPEFRALMNMSFDKKD